jgi:membrane-associated phospholipid phosphatase
MSIFGSSPSPLPAQRSVASRPLPRSVRRVGLVTLGLMLAGATSCRKGADVDPGMVSEWVHSLYGVIRVERLSPPVASRLTAYATMALYGGVSAVHNGLTPLSRIVRGMYALPRAERAGDVDATLVAVAAERVVLDTLLREALPTTRASLSRLADSLVATRTSAGVSAAVHAASDSLGRRIGLAIVEHSRVDHFAETRTRAFVPAVGEAMWINDAPASTYATQNLSAVSEFVALDNPANQQRAGNTSDRGLILSRPKRPGDKTLLAANMAGATEPFWGEIRPFVLETRTSCELPDLLPYGRDSSVVLYREAYAVYAASKALTEPQRTIAYYWADNAGETGTPVGHWLSIAAQMIGERKLDADAAVRLVLGTSLAQADAFIAAWGYKYQFNVLRPRTYIRRFIDSTWEPLIPTPPFPEYPSGHSTQSGAASAVISALLTPGAFSDSTSVSIGHQVRHFDSFLAASEEAGLSRVLAGLHYPLSNREGIAMGRCIGNRVAAALGAAPPSRP